jgi:alkylhydroperoxidase family enzyme
MVATLLDADASPLFTEAEKAAIALAKESTAKVAVSEATFERARAHFGERELVEMVVNVGVANLNNRITDAFDADLEDEPL